MRPIGYAIAFLSLQTVPPAYKEAVELLRAARWCTAPYERPPPTSDGRVYKGLSTLGNKLVDNTLISEALDPIKHIADALRLSFPEPSFDVKLATELIQAIAYAMESKDIVAEREAQSTFLRGVAELLLDFNSQIVAAMPASVHSVASGTNVAMIAALVEARDWPDWRLAEGWAKGFNIAGDGSANEPGVLSSGLFRQCFRPAEFSVEDLSNGQTALPSNAAWFDQLEVTIKERVRAATKSGDPLKLRPWQVVAETIAKERGVTPNPTIGKGMTYRQLVRFAVKEYGGIDKCRPLLRFAIQQGVKEDGSAKWRGIDDALRNGINRATTTYETISYVTFEFPAQVARAVYEWCQRNGKPMPELSTALDDMRHAYRTVPNAQPFLSIVAAWSFAAACVMYYVVPGHVFGMTAAVLNFNRFPHFVVSVARTWLAAWVDHYVDDYMELDLSSAGDSCQRAVEVAHQILGHQTEVSKRKLPASANVNLGVGVCLADVARRLHVTAFAVPSRVARTMAEYARCRDRRKCLPRQAASIHGKVGYLLVAAWSRVGRAGGQPLIQRATADHAPYSWSVPLEHSFQFFTALFENLPRLSIPLAREERKPVLVYTDASFHWANGRVAKAILAFVIIDPTTGMMMFASIELPLAYYRFFAADKETYIMQAELVAAIAAYFSMPETLRGRPVIHFIDNTGALSALVNGYAGKEDCARFVNMFHIQLLGLQSKVYFDWVPSKANIADWPTRADKIHLMPSNAHRVAFVLPQPYMFDQSLSEWIGIVRRSVSYA